ncbi:unnamed protein product [Phaeothamnion confervicola]
MSGDDNKYLYKYPRPSVTVDSCIFVVEEAQPWILLIKRSRDPFAGSWALPGGFLDPNEDLQDAARRELLEETGVAHQAIVQQVGAYGKPGRDPRGHTVTVAYMAFVPSKNCGVQAGDDAAEAEWHPLAALPATAFDHDDIISAAWARCAFSDRPGAAGGGGGVIRDRATSAELGAFDGVHAAVLSGVKPTKK